MNLPEGKVLLPITPEQAHNLYKDVQLYTNFGKFGRETVKPWDSVEVCKEDPLLHDPLLPRRLGQGYKWFLVVDKDTESEQA